MTWSPLPFELVAEIFELVHEQDDRRWLPTIISLVSSEWRAFALLIPRLWTRIHISHDDYETGLPTAATWVERSGSVPVTVVFDFQDRPYNQTFPASVDFICSHLTRIGELDVTIRTEDQANEVIKALCKPAPNLRRFRIHSFSNKRNINTWSVNDLHAGSFLGNQVHPKLQSLGILSPHSKWSLQPIKHVTELELTTFGKITISLLRSMFENMPCISTLKVCENDEAPGLFESWLGTPITVPSITCAHLKGGSMYKSIYFLQLLDLPHLHSLHLDTLVYGGHNHHTNHHTPFPILDTLTLSMNTQIVTYTVEPALPLLLKRCDSVTHLCLRVGGDLTPLRAFGQGQCPRMAHLDIYEEVYNLNYDDLDWFLGTRTPDKYGELAAIKTLSFSGLVSLSEEKASKYCGLTEVMHMGKKLQ